MAGSTVISWIGSRRSSRRWCVTMGCCASGAGRCCRRLRGSSAALTMMPRPGSAAGRSAPSAQHLCQPRLGWPYLRWRGRRFRLCHPRRRCSVTCFPNWCTPTRRVAPACARSRRSGAAMRRRCVQLSIRVWLRTAETVQCVTVRIRLQCRDIRSLLLGIGMRDDAQVQPGNALEIVWIAGVQRKPLGDCRCGDQGIVSSSRVLAPSGS